jgi:hypothetical protein
MYDALKYTVGLRLDELRAQQQRAITVAAADGVLLGFVAALSAGAAGPSRALVLAALILLALGLVAATVAIWPRTMPMLGSQNPALAGDDDSITAEMCSLLSATLSGPDLRDAFRIRGYAIAAQMALVGAALLVLVAASFGTNPAAAPSNTVPTLHHHMERNSD